MRQLVFPAATALILLAAAPAAPAAGDRPGRFVMNPAEGGGFVRLDTETGAVAVCARKDAEWSCLEMADTGKGLREEIDRLKAENRELQVEIRRLEDMLLPDGDKKGAPERRAERPGGRFELPSEEDVDRAMSYVERMFRKFRDKLKELESQERRGTPL